MNPFKRFSKRKIILFSAVVILVLGVVFVVALPAISKPPNLSASLSEKVGVVNVRDNANASYNPVNDGFQLKSIMQLETLEESRVRLDLSTGSIVRIGQSTIFSLQSLGNDSEGSGLLSTIQLQAGRLFIILKGGSVDVNTPGGLASVRGSYMSVWVEPNNNNRITVCCLEGSCGYKNAASDVDLTSGQKVVSPDTNTPSTVVKMNQADIQPWLNNSPESVPIVSQISGLLATDTPTISPANPVNTPANSASATPTVNLTNTAIPGTQTPAATIGTGTVIPNLIGIPSSTPLIPLTGATGSTPSAGQATPTGLNATPIDTNTPVPLPTDTSSPQPSNTPVPVLTDTASPLPSNTPLPPPTNTSLPSAPTNTPLPPPTNTPLPPPTNTSIPYSPPTSVPPPPTSVPPPPTPVPPPPTPVPPPPTPIPYP